MDYKKHLKVMIYTFYAVLGVLAVYFVFKRNVLTWFLPFLFGLLAAILLNRPVTFLREKLHLSRGIGTLLVLFLSLGVLGTALFFLGRTLYHEAVGLVNRILIWSQDLPTLYDRFMYWADTLKLPFETGNLVRMGVQQLAGSAPSLLRTAATFLGNLVIALPSIFSNAVIFFIAFLLSAFFFCKDKEIIMPALRKFLPPRVHVWFSNLRNTAAFTAWSYLKAYAILMAITALELLVGFWIIGVDYALLLALIVSVIDILPILGVGTVLLPWGVYALVIKDYRLGVGLLLLYAVIWVIRQFLEPKIVSNQIGMHPLLTLISMYIGLRAVGFWGMLLFPMALLIFMKTRKGAENAPIPAKTETEDIKNGER